MRFLAAFLCPGLCSRSEETVLLLELSSLWLCVTISYLSWTSVHLLFLQWKLGGIFECLMFTVGIADLFSQ